MPEVTINVNAIDAWLSELREDVGASGSFSIRDRLWDKDLGDTVLDKIFSSANENDIFLFDGKISNEVAVHLFVGDEENLYLGLRSKDYSRLDMLDSGVKFSDILEAHKSKIEDKDLVVAILSEASHQGGLRQTRNSAKIKPSQTGSRKSRII